MFHHNGHDDIIVDVLQGKERIVFYPISDQSNTHSLSAMNFARVLFELLHNHGQERLIDVIRAITSEQIIADIISMCSGWSNELHLGVEDIQCVPPFDKSLNHVSTHHGVPDAAYFTRALQDMQMAGSFAAVIITCLPQTIACMKITELGLDIFVIFDPHPRSSYPSGASLILSTSIDQAVARLIGILPAINESELQLQARSLSNVSSHIFVSGGPPGDAQDVQRSAIESGLAVLKLQAEVAALKQENVRLTSKNEVLAGNVEQLEGSSNVQKTIALEDTQLEEAAVASSSRNFSCAICMDEHPVDNTVELDCNHPICRDCVRGHVCAKIEEHRFPVFCPVCMTEKNDQPGVISGLLVQLIGVDEGQYTIWEQMELSQHSVLIHCRRCGRSVPVDRQEHEETKTLICPLPNCNHSWCKACQQPINSEGPPHSCDGTAELDDLMQRQGWKYCPNCRTPVERDGGCRHMTCISPGCNTHFCWGCGGCIIRSALQNEIQNAVGAHYSGTCQMFDVDNDNVNYLINGNNNINVDDDSDDEVVVDDEGDDDEGGDYDEGVASEYDVDVSSEDDEGIEGFEYTGSDGVQYSEDVEIGPGEGVEDDGGIEYHEGVEYSEDVEVGGGVEEGDAVEYYECFEHSEGMEYGEGVEDDEPDVEDDEPDVEDDEPDVEGDEGMQYGESAEDVEGLQVGGDEPGVDDGGHEGSIEHDEGIEDIEGIEYEQYDDADEVHEDDQDEGIEDDQDEDVEDDLADFGDDHDVEDGQDIDFDDFEDDGGDDYYYSD